jgi:general nucleoside transport system ATP-binding protein
MVTPILRLCDRQVVDPVDLDRRTDAAAARIHAEIMARAIAAQPCCWSARLWTNCSNCRIVMFHGKLVHEARASEADLTEIGRHMAGH